MAKHKNEQHDEHAPNIKSYMMVFAALMALTVVTVAISKIHLPRPQAIGLGLFVACVKAALVGAVFMHLWGEKKLIHVSLWITAACAAILVIVMIDGSAVAHRSTSPMAVADQHPAPHGEAAHAVSHETHAPPAPAPAKAAPKAGKGKAKAEAKH